MPASLRLTILPGKVHRIKQAPESMKIWSVKCLVLIKLVFIIFPALALLQLLPPHPLTVLYIPLCYRMGKDIHWVRIMSFKLFLEYIYI